MPYLKLLLRLACTTMAAAIPRVAVLGGGVAGCAAASRLSRLGAHVTMIEMGRGVGGRVATRRTREDKRIEVDHGAPFAQFMTPEGLTMAQELAEKGWIEEVTEPVGSLKPGSSDLVCSAEGAALRHFKGKPNMSRWCEGLLDGSEVSKKFGNMVRGLEVNRDADGKVLGWRIFDKDQGLMEECDWLVVTGSGVAHSRWSKTFGGSPPLVEAAAGLNDSKLDSAIASIEAVGSQPVQTAMLGFEGDAAASWSNLPFAVAEIDGDEVIGKIIIQRRNGMVFVVAHSTHAFAQTSIAYGSTSTAARLGGAANDAGTEEQVLEEILKGVDRCLAGFSPKPSREQAVFGPLLHRWGNAFPERSALASLEDGFSPHSRVAFAGDYVGQRSGSIEGAMLSGAGVADLLMLHLKQ